MIKLLQQSLNTKNITDVFDTDFINSVNYGAGIRSAGSEWHFKYNDTYLGIRVNPTLYGTFPQFTQISIIIDGEHWQTDFFTDTSLHEYTLPAGSKIVQLIESVISKPSNIIGTFITEVKLNSYKFTKINESSVSEKVVFLGDSITVGANADTPSLEGYPYLFKYQSNKEVGVLGYGYGTVKDFAETTPKITATVAHITEMFSNVVTTKTLLIALGTNDFALDSTPAATLKVWFGNLLDAINTADSDIDIHCLSPLIRSSDGALLDQYRTDIGDLCSTRDYCTHIAGKTILTTGDLDDGVHPTTAGHKKLKDNLNI